MGVHSVAYGSHLYLVCAVCDVTIWRHIDVSKPTFSRNLLTQYAHSATRTPLNFYVIALDINQGLKHAAGLMWPARAFCAARDAFGEFSNIEHLLCQVPCKKMPRKNWTKAEWCPVPFLSRPQHYRPNFHSAANFWEILRVHQRRLHMHCRPRESIWPGSSWKALEVLREYGVDGRLLLAVKSLYSCSEVCVRVGRVKWDFCEETTVWHRGVPRWDGARGMKQVWRRHVWI